MTCKHEMHNPNDSFAVAVTKDHIANHWPFTEEILGEILVIFAKWLDHLAMH